MEGREETEGLQRRNHELSVLNEVARELNRPVGLGDALDFALSQVAELLGLSTGWIWLTSESGEAYLAATRNLPPVLVENPQLLDGSSYCYCLDTFKSGDLEGAANVNVVSCSRLKGLPEGTDGLRYHASIPLYSGPDCETKLGVMNVAGPDWRSLSPDDLRLLYTIGDLLGIAVERGRLAGDRRRLGASEERNRLAREMHDTIAQGLSATALQLESAEAMLLSDPERAARSVRRALELTRSNLDEARRSVLDLRAAPLEERPLSEALAALVERWETERCDEAVSARFIPVNGAHPLPPNVEAALYRISQESLTNVARHADATRIIVRLVIGPDRVRLSVEDNGRGISSSEREGGPERHGLVGMHERVRLLDGEFSVEDRPGGGTKVTAEIPLEGK